MHLSEFCYDPESDQPYDALSEEDDDEVGFTQVY